jgi:hypothetical protein
VIPDRLPRPVVERFAGDPAALGAFAVLMEAMADRRASGFWLRDDDDKLRRLVGLPPLQWRRVRSRLESFAERDGDGRWRFTLFREVEAFRRSRQAAGRVGGLLRALKELVGRPVVPEPGEAHAAALARVEEKRAAYLSRLALGWVGMVARVDEWRALRGRPPVADRPVTLPHERSGENLVLARLQGAAAKLGLSLHKRPARPVVKALVALQAGDRLLLVDLFAGLLLPAADFLDSWLARGPPGRAIGA